MTYKHFNKIMDLCGIEVYYTGDSMQLWKGDLAVGGVSLYASYNYEVTTIVIQDERTRKDVTDAIYELGNTPIEKRGVRI